MRPPRIKPPGAIHHVIDNLGSKEFWLKGIEKRAYLEIMHRVADFLQIKIVGFSLMDNHIHTVLSVPFVIELTDEELLVALKQYKGEKNQETRAFAKAMEFGGPNLEILRTKYTKRMGDISEFKKSHKHIYTKWYNGRKKRRGTVYGERFTNLVVENSRFALQTVCAYIDLNPVRAAMVSDPKDYPFCGYTAALMGDQRYQKSIMKIMGVDDWEQAAAEYRLLLMQSGHRKKVGKRGSITRELLLKTIKEKGVLSHAEILRVRNIHLSQGCALGSPAFVTKIFDRHRSHFGKKRKQASFPLEEYGEDSLHVLRLIRQ